MFGERPTPNQQVCHIYIECIAFYHPIGYPWIFHVHRRYRRSGCHGLGSSLSCLDPYTSCVFIARWVQPSLRSSTFIVILFILTQDAFHEEGMVRPFRQRKTHSKQGPSTLEPCSSTSILLGRQGIGHCRTAVRNLNVFCRINVNHFRTFGQVQSRLAYYYIPSLALLQRVINESIR